MSKICTPQQDVFMNRRKGNPKKWKSIKLNTVLISNMIIKLDKSELRMPNIKSQKKCIRKQRAFSPSVTENFKQRLVSPNARRKIEIKKKISSQIVKKMSPIEPGIVFREYTLEQIQIIDRINARIEEAKKLRFSGLRSPTILSRRLYRDVCFSESRDHSPLNYRSKELTSNDSQDTLRILNIRE